MTLLVLILMYIRIHSKYIHTQIHINVGRGRDKGMKALALLEALIEALLNTFLEAL